MTSRTRTPIVCECGHTGNELLKENDQPFSRMYEEYSLEGFSGGTHTVEGFHVGGSVLDILCPTCPKCGETGKVKYASRS